MGRVRVFVAIDLDAAARNALRNALAELAPAPGWRSVLPDAVHLTLAFLGSIDADRITDVTGAIERACTATPAFALTVQNAGFFPDAEAARVAWMGVGGDTETLATLERALHGELSALGFALEDRAFHPHLTLARRGKDRIPADVARAFVAFV